MVLYVPTNDSGEVDTVNNYNNTISESTIRNFRIRESKIDLIDSAYYTSAPSPTQILETPTPTPVTEQPVIQEIQSVTPVVIGGLETLICSYPWPCWEAISIAQCESGVNINGELDGVWAVSWTGTSYGLFQLNKIHVNKWPDFWENWMIPEWNVAHAFEMWSTSGWGPWDCW